MLLLIRGVLGNVSVEKKNAAGDTALHTATMLGHRGSFKRYLSRIMLCLETITLLLEADAPVNLKNNNGWSPLVEAISYGSRDTSKYLTVDNITITCLVTEMLKSSRKQARGQLSARKPHLLKMLNGLQDFCVEFKWTFQSWSQSIFKKRI